MYLKNVAQTYIIGCLSGTVRRPYLLYINKNVPSSGMTKRGDVIVCISFSRQLTASSLRPQSS